ncbi:MAG: outer membrane protein transport protein [Planctomycetaceae bacterium]|nr:outer membrane protein transport protein [Planctomycetaceae bacterium]
MRSMCLLRRTLIMSLLFCVAGRVASAQGFVLSGSGAINRSMAGAGTAAPLDAIGALQWNPASITALSSGRADLAVETVFNRNEVGSTVGLDTPFEFGGNTSSDAGAAPLPAIGVILPNGDSNWAVGLGLNAVGGFSVNFPADPTNPVLAPPAAGGFGPAYTRFSVLQIAPTLARKFESGWSIGIAPTINVAEAQASPFAFAAPNDANGDSTFTYASGVGTQPTWGLGVQGGIFYEGSGWSAGFSAKSPQWFQSFKINAGDELGLPLPLKLDLTYPMILSWGLAAQVTEDLLVAVDVRYLDFAGTSLFGDPAAFAPDGRALGLGWRSTVLTALGVQYEVCDWCTLRAGYSYAPNPVRDGAAMFSVQAPAVYEHLLSLGTTLRLSSRLSLSCAWVHAFEHTVTGPLITPAGAVPLSEVRVSQVVDSVVMGLSYDF